MDPLEDAAARLTKLIAAGTAPAHVTKEVGAIVSSWADEPEMNPGIAQARIAHLWDGFTKEAADLQAMIADQDTGDAGDLVLARRVLAAMNAAVETLGAALDQT